MKTRFPWAIFVPLIVFVLLGVTLGIALYKGMPVNKFATHMYEPVPATHLPVMNETTTFFDPQDWIGRPYIVNFFASWCVECRGEHIQLMTLQNEHVPIVGIALEDKAPALAKLFAKEGNPFVAVVDDAKGRTSIDWGLTGVPETFVIDAKGIIRLHYVGPMTDRVIARDVLPLWRDMLP